jgi:hypothetical protein
VAEYGALLLFPIGFVLIFRGVGAWMLHLAGRAVGERHADADLNAMVWSLVPIAVAYHLAHYVSLLLTTGQFIIPLASDPFGWGWNLFGTRGHAVDLGIVSPGRVLVRCGCADRHRPCAGSHRRPCRSDASLRESPSGSAEPVADARADGGLHEPKPVDHGATHRGLTMTRKSRGARRPSVREPRIGCRGDNSPQGRSRESEARSVGRA